MVKPIDIIYVRKLIYISLFMIRHLAYTVFS